MLDSTPNAGFYTFAEVNYLRLEAMDIFERCLTEGKPDYLEAFVHKQLVQQPPRLELLQEVAEELHQRLIGLREHHFDVRERVVHTLSERFNLDLSLFAPANALAEFHLLVVNDVVDGFRNRGCTISPRQEAALRKLLDASLEMAGQLHDDMAMTESLYDFVMEWLLALNAIVARRVELDDEQTPVVQ